MTPDTPFNTDYYQPKKPEPKVAKTVLPERPIKSFNSWINWVYKQVKKVA